MATEQFLEEEEAKRFDAIYDNGLDGWGFAFRRSQLYRYEKYMKLLGHIKTDVKRILEVGCGDGYFSGSWLRPCIGKMFTGGGQRYTDAIFRHSSSHEPSANILRFPLSRMPCLI